MENKRRHKLTYSDIDLTQWKDYEEVLTDSLWIMSSRQSTNGHKFDYHGNFIPQIANQVFQRYTKEGEIVVDWFLGSGTSAIEADNLNRRLIGVELKPEMVEHVRGKLPAQSLESDIRLVNADSTSRKAKQLVEESLQQMGTEQAHLAILHPPYADIIKFSQRKRDLSNCSTTSDFIDKFKLVAQNAYHTLAPGRFAILVIGDKYANGELDPLGFKCMQAMNEAGFRSPQHPRSHRPLHLLHNLRINRSRARSINSKYHLKHQCISDV